MNKKKTLGIVIVGILGTLAVFFAIGAYNVSASKAEAAELARQIGPVNAQQPQAVENEIAVLLGNEADRMNNIDWRQTALDIIQTGEYADHAKLVVHTDSSWHTTILDSDGISESHSGFGSDSIDFKCGKFGTYSVVAQASSSYSNGLNAYVAQDGQIQKQAGTGASYGVVSFAGTCV